MDEPAVTVFIQGAGEWRRYQNWPPATDRRRLSDDNGGDGGFGSEARLTVDDSRVYRPDPTVGALGGLWSVGSTFGLPLDQADDDRRSLCATSEPLSHDLVVVGRPSVIIHLTDGSHAERIVVRLNDVDPDGGSAFVTTGVSCDGAVELYPTAYRFAAGHRLRVAIGDAEFPRLWPVLEAPTFGVTRIELELPVVGPDVGEIVAMPTAADRGGQVPDMRGTPIWSIARSPLDDGIEVISGAEWSARTAGGEHILERHAESRSTVRRDAPEAAVIFAHDRQRARLSTGETLEAIVKVRLASAALWVSGEVTVDGETVFSRSWDAIAPSQAPAGLAPDLVARVDAQR
jgi:hypothetical protein